MADTAYTVASEGGVEVVRLLEPKMSPGTLEELQAELSRRIDAGARSMLLNLAPVKFLDSFGIGVIAAAARRIQQAGGELKLCGASERVRMSLTITRLDRSLDIAADEAEALQRFRGQG